MLITNNELIKLKRLAEEATHFVGGDWGILASPENSPDCKVYEVVDFVESGCGHICDIEVGEVANFIASASPATILALIAEIERLKVKAGESD